MHMKLSVHTDGGSKLSSLAPVDKGKADQQLTGTESKAPELAKRSSGRRSSNSSCVISSVYNAIFTLYW